MEVRLEMTAGEAMFAQGALSKAAADAFTAWRKLILSNAPADEQDVAMQAAQILARVDARLQAALYPPCDWLEECDRQVAGTAANGARYCAFHLSLMERQDRFLEKVAVS